MTQALNLALFANNLNTSGATSNAGLQNSSVTVTAGTGMSGGGAVALGSSVTLTNAGVTSFNGSTGAVTFSGGVTSAVAGNGVAVSASTGAVTFSLGAPTAFTIGTYVIGTKDTNNNTSSNGTTGTSYAPVYTQSTSDASSNQTRSGTWTTLGQSRTTASGSTCTTSLFLRIA
jgi:hypothetical protein